MLNVSTHVALKPLATILQAPGERLLGREPSQRKYNSRGSGGEERETEREKVRRDAVPWTHHFFGGSMEGRRR